MKIIKNSLNMVINGDWNKTYIEPSWLTEKVFKAEEVELEIIGQGLDYSVQIRSNNIAIQPSRDRVMIICINILDEGLTDFEKVCNSFLQECISPKVTSYGFNLRFEEEDTTSYSDIVDNISDTNLLIENGATIESTNITRKLCYKDKPYSLTFSNEKGKLQIRCNSHFNCNSTSDKIVIPENEITNFMQNCIEILTFCGYSIEEED